MSGAPPVAPARPASEGAPAILDAERVRVAARREALKCTSSPHDRTIERPPDQTVGLALSGGGIRSATFSLGLLRALGRAGMIPYIDYLSTVSGGGYTGAFLCSCYVPCAVRGDTEQSKRAPPPVGGTDDPFAGVDGERRLEHLRQSGRYLLPNSTGDAVSLMVIMSRSWLAIHAVIGLSLVAVIMTFKLVQALYLRWDWALDLEAYGAEVLGLPPSLWPSQWMEGATGGHWFITSWLWLVSAPFLLVTTGLFWAYFLTRTASADGPRLVRVIRGPSMVVGLIGLGAGLLLMLQPDQVGIGLAAPRGLGFLLLALSIVAVSGYALAEFADFLETSRQLRTIRRILGHDEPAPADQMANSPGVQEDRVRRRLTDWATFTLKWALFIAALALFDTIAQTIYVRRDELANYAVAGTASIALVPLLRQLIIKLPALGRGGRKSLSLLARFGRVAALLAGLILALVLGIFWAFLAQALAWRNGPIGGIAAVPPQSPLWVLELTVAGLLIAFVAIGFSFGFLNLSSYANFYAVRLRRAYLGASNQKRWLAGKSVFPINADHIDDDIALDRYYDADVMAPLHLINVTINDTSSGSSNTVQRDRRGKPLTISPAGFIYSGDERSDLRLLPFDHAGDGMGCAPEKLPLSAWIGISGAAASTGMGQFGSLGLSLLAGLANVRMGNWWDPGQRDQRRLQNLVQGRLAAEFLGRFPGTDGRRWYLTDGGHFENSGAYELVRRRVRLIILCDNGADPKYEFADLVNLTRRIRIDFGAELTFAGTRTLRRLLADDDDLLAAFGTVQQLCGAQQEDKRIGPYAALGRIHYLDDPDRGSSTILLIKPRVCGHEARDLVAYAKANPPFPQQTTLDQFFDEAQWESYFRLGQRIGDTLFEHRVGGKWHPWHMLPIGGHDWDAVEDVAD